MRVFVTGASGFLGGAVVERLAAEPGRYEVLAMARSEESADKVRALGASPVRASLEDVSGDVLRGVDAVVHAAAFVEEWGTREAFFRGNVAGTTRMLEAARAGGVRRFIHVSTEAVLFTGEPLVDVDETHPYPARQRFLYSETKAEAERRVLAAHHPGVFDTLALRPRLVWGPGDTTILPALVSKVRAGQFAWIDGGRQKTVTTHVRNFAHAAALALHQGQGGACYFISDDEVQTFRAFASALLESQGLDGGNRALPGFIARAAAAVLEGVWRTLGIESAPPITRLAAAMLSCDCTLRIDRARRELGYSPVVSVAEGLAGLRAASSAPTRA